MTFQTQIVKPAILTEHKFIRYIFYCSAFFLPFNQAATIDIGFPLKISELGLSIVTILFISTSIYNTNFQLLFPGTFFKYILALSVIAVTSFIVNQIYPFKYPLTEVSYRYGLTLNSLCKSFYVFLCFSCCLIFYYFYKFQAKSTIRFILAGALVSGLYGWYLFIFSLNNLPTYLLPGMEEWPQHGLYSFGHFIRSGTFKEGNYAGLYFLICAIIAFREKLYWISLLLVACILPTVSVMALTASFIMCFSLLTFHVFYKKKYSLGIVGILIVIGLIGISRNDPDARFILSKLTLWEKAANPEAENSKQERMYLIRNAWNIGKDNLFLGVGLANYNAHLKHYEEKKNYDTTKFKFIPNNIYAEIFSELGLLGLIVFTLIIYHLVKCTLTRKDSILTSGIISILLYFLAYPSFTFLFIWAFFAYVLAKSEGEVVNPSSSISSENLVS